MRAEERVPWAAAIFPHRLTRAGLEFDDPRKRVPIDIAAVSEQGDISICQWRAVVRHAPAIVAVLPFHLAAVAIDEPHHIEAPKTDQDIAIRQRRDCIGVRELIAALTWADWIFLNVHVAARVPFPDDLAGWTDLAEAVTVHAAVGMWRVRQPTRHPQRDLGRHHLPGKKQCVPVRQASEVVMLPDVPMLPHDMALPVVF